MLQNKDLRRARRHERAKKLKRQEDFRQLRAFLWKSLKYILPLIVLILILRQLI